MLEACFNILLLLVFNQGHNLYRPAQDSRPKTRVVDDLMHGTAPERRLK